MNTNAEPATEQEVRALRDAVFGTEPRYRSDVSWEACKEKWMKPENVAWLRRQPQNQIVNHQS